MARTAAGTGHAHVRSGARRTSIASRLKLLSRGRLFAICGLATILALVVAAGTARSASTTLYVDQAASNCSNTGPGSATQPFCTISAAAAKASAGTTVLVSGGTYREQVTARSGAAGAPVEFRAAPGATPTVTGGTYGFYVSGKSWVDIVGFNVTATVSDGIHVSSSSSNVEVRDNRVSFAGQPVEGKTAKGISVSNSSDVLVDGNSVDHNSNYGIYIDTSTSSQVSCNNVSANAKVFQRAASGIRLYRSPGNTVSGNVTHDNEDSGIEVYTDSDASLLVNNVSYGNGDHGIDTFSSSDEREISNSVYSNLTAGINVEASSTGATLENNVSVDNGINSPRTKGNIRVDSTSLTGAAIDYDMIDAPAGEIEVVWAGTNYSTLAGFTAATGQEAHGIQDDPHWASPSTGDLHLTAGSRAVDSADSGATGETDSDAEGNPRVDDPGTPNRGTGPRAYDDRGAYELSPSDLPPAAAVTATPDSGSAPLEVQADASASSDTDATPIESYDFDFGDGATSGTQASPTAKHTYKDAGRYTLAVTVTDSAGRSSTATVQVTVTAPPDFPPNASLTVAPPSGSAPLDVTADASASTDADVTPIASYSFDFGDGTSTGPQPTATADHTYTESGTYTVQVTVTDTGGQSSVASTQVTVTATDDVPPAAVLAVSPTSGEAPLGIVADASASTDTDATPIASYNFDFGDGAGTGEQSAATASHTYAAAGSYTVTVTVTDTGGKSSTATTQVTVTAPDLPPSPQLSVSPGTGIAPLAVTADASGSTDGDASPIATYSFDFGDGTTTGEQSSPTAAHTYTFAGTYTVRVTVTDTAGKAASATSQVTVQANLAGNSGFETSLGGWNTSGSDAGTQLTRVQGGHSGDWAAALTNTGTSRANCTLNDSPNWVVTTSDATYTGSIWVRADSPGATLKLRWREWNGNTLVGTDTALATLSTSWQKVTVQHAVVAPGSTTLDFNAYVSGVPPGNCFYADDVTISSGG